jgi:hypothetical protein
MPKTPTTTTAFSRKRILGQRNYHHLTVRDLLEAREAYHVHLINMENVVATAIGRFRIRKDDPDAETATKDEDYEIRKKAPERMFDNTVVTQWSWPCLLVFVNRWSDRPASSMPCWPPAPDLPNIRRCSARSGKGELRGGESADRSARLGLPRRERVSVLQRVTLRWCAL